MKRGFDLFFCIPAFFILSPLFCLLGVIIKLDGTGPIFFRQKRIGKDYRTFDIYKFRTMTQEAEKEGPRITCRHDSRITKIGKLLRKLKLDELPQLFNVFKGEMSIVGPRPEVEEYAQLYSEAYEKILSVKPGITDLSSLVFRNEEELLSLAENPEDYYKEFVLPKKIHLALQHMHRASLLYDLRIVAFTLFRIVGLPTHAIPIDRVAGLE